MEGNIVVDGVLASCYAFSDHDLAHLGMTPMRWFPGMMNWIFGSTKETPGYVSFAEDLGKDNSTLSNYVLNHDTINK